MTDPRRTPRFHRGAATTAGVGIALALTLAAPAAAQNCPPIAEGVTFCKDTTDWAEVPMRPDMKDGRIANLTLYGPDTVLIFSQVPEFIRNDLPRRRSHDTAAEAVQGLLKLYKGATELDRFAPLGPEKAVATLAFHDGAAGWVNVITYYLEGGTTLVIQTAQKGATTLTDQHRNLHVETVQALRDAP